MLLSLWPACVIGHAADRSASIKISPNDQQLAVVNHDSRSVTLLALPGLEQTAEIFVGRGPQTASFNPDGKLLYVTNRLDDTVSVIDLEQLKVAATIEVPDEPIGVVVSVDGRVFVSCMQAGNVVVIDPGTKLVTNVITTEAGPRGLAVSNDGAELYLTHFGTGRFSVINTTNMVVEQSISTGLDTNLTNSVLLNQPGTLAYLPQTRSNVSNQALLFDTTVFPVVSVIDLLTRTHVQASRIHLDISDRPVNMPFDSALVGESTLFVLNSGSNDISVINLNSGNGVAHIEVGDNPNGMALSADDSTLYVNNRLSGTVMAIDTTSYVVSREVTVTQIPLSPKVLNGKRLFHSSNRTDLARDQWISCATCHFDGEMDGRTWFFPDGPRNSTSLLGVSETQPVHWSGDLDELQDVEITVRDIQAGTGLAVGGDNCTPACNQGEPNTGRSQDLDDLAAFMASLKLPPNPNLGPDGALSNAAARGKLIFESDQTQCSACHIPPVFNDRQKHDVGTGNGPGERKGSAFDTPSLRGIYKTAPYLHHGAAESLLDVLTTQNPGDLHGTTSHLQANELTDLVAYLQSLGNGATFQINAGLNDAWVNVSIPFQGMFITVFPTLKLLFLAWFTFDSTVPPALPAAVFGANDQRWITAVGGYAGSSASLKAELTSGGVFNASTPVPAQNTSYGTIDIEFNDCSSGIVKFDFPAAGQSGEFSIQRVLTSNVALCETLSP